MKNNKTADCNSLCTEHFKIAGDVYCNVLAVCYNVMLTHGHMPAEASQIVAYFALLSITRTATFLSHLTIVQ